MEEIHQATKQKRRLIRAAVYAVVETWECTFKKELKQNEELQDLVKNMTWVSPLDPRDAFYGGRTDMAKCYHTAEEGEQIFYQDFTSLYPTINKYGTYPPGSATDHCQPRESKHPRLLWNCQGRCARSKKLLHPMLL